MDKVYQIITELWPLFDIQNCVLNKCTDFAKTLCYHITLIRSRLGLNHFIFHEF